MQAELAIDAQSAFITALQSQVFELTAALEDSGGQLFQSSDSPHSDLEDSLERRTSFGHITPAAIAPDAHPATNGNTSDGGRHSSAVAVGVGDSTSSLPASEGMRSLPRHATGITITEEDEGTDGAWGDPASWHATSPVVPLGSSRRTSGAKRTSRDVSECTEASHGAPTAPSSPAPSADRSSVLHSSGDGAMLAHLMELSSLREDNATLRRRREVDAEELASRAEEIANLSALLEGKQEEMARNFLELPHLLAAATEAGAETAQAAALAHLRGYTCELCASQPFADLVDVAGVKLVHDHTCFAREEAQAALKRVEERAAVLQTEVNDLKSFISESRMQAEAAAIAAATATASKSVSLAPPVQSTSAQLLQQSGTGVTAEAPSGRAVPESSVSTREVVDVQVMQQLQSKLSGLIHVHRQLLRKYAVVDVECVELVEALTVRSGSRSSC